MLLRFSQFRGAALAPHPMFLPDGVGVDSRNQLIGRGDLRPLKAPATVATVGSSTLTIYRMGRSAPSDTSYWFAWTTDVDVARGFIAEDSSERTFWSGDGGVPKWTNNIIGLGAAPYPDSSGVRILGVPKPNATPSLSQTVAGSGTDETRAYVVTWVNDMGEESMPSTAATITCKPGATIRVTRNATVPTGAYGLSSWRVYRTVAGNDEDYFYVGSAAAATSYLDTTDSTLNTSDPLLSEAWAMPPSDLKGLKALWNGILVGWSGKALCFSEAYRPFAWPAAYQIPVDDDIVALGRWQQQLLVLTVGKPYLVTGSSPEAMSVQPLEFRHACVAKRGVVEFGHGVAWPAPDGLAYYGSSGPRLLTENLMLRSDWQANVTPSTLVAGENEGRYIGSFDPAGAAPRASLEIDPLDPAAGILFHDAAFIGCFRDSIGDGFYTLESGWTGNVQKWNTGTTATAKFKSRLERVERPTCFAWGQVVADAYPVTLSMWAGGTQILTNYSVTGRGAFRLPAGFRSDLWQIEVSTTGAVQGVFLAHSIDELNAS